MKHLGKIFAGLLFLGALYFGAKELELMSQAVKGEAVTESQLGSVKMVEKIIAFKTGKPVLPGDSEGADDPAAKLAASLSKLNEPKSKPPGKGAEPELPPGKREMHSADIRDVKVSKGGRSGETAEEGSAVLVDAQGNRFVVKSSRKPPTAKQKAAGFVDKFKKMLPRAEPDDGELEDMGSMKRKATAMMLGTVFFTIILVIVVRRRFR